MSLFVTGGTGYLGSAVTAALLADGHTVRAHVRSIASVDRLPAGVEPVVGDLGNAAWLRARIDESDGVVHAASPNDATSGSFDAALLDVALSALAGSDRPLVYTGGTWVHGSGDPITEESPISPPPMVAWRPAILNGCRPRPPMASEPSSSPRPTCCGAGAVALASADVRFGQGRTRTLRASRSFIRR
jgi:nucleoside-diphosphate-sugar epimerase